jgi:hypothetical protein
MISSAKAISFIGDKIMKKIITVLAITFFTIASISAVPAVVLTSSPLSLNLNGRKSKESSLTKTYISIDPLFQISNSLVDTTSSYDLNYGFDFNLQNYYKGSSSGSSVSMAYLVGDDYNEFNLKVGYAYKMSSNSNFDPYITISPELSFDFSDNNDSIDLDATYIGIDGVLGLRYFLTDSSNFALNAGLDTSALYKLSDVYDSSDEDYKLSATAFIGFSFSIGR